MSDMQWKFAAGAGTALLFLGAIALNELLFSSFEFARGISWVYLPAGVRLLCTLLFAEAGALGILAASWLICFFYFFPDDPIRSFIGGILAALAPYLTYRMLVAGRIDASLAGLGPWRLLGCALAFSLASPALHHLWFALRGQREGLLDSFLVMASGDLVGTLIVLYGAKLLLLLRRP
ncbi:hypothetical protein LE190_11365 [Massilia oculi]|uniref:MASE1 domain-containing protein n=1 Tax=Massilia hydrophila TaxID=3044279 RepID=A0ABS7YAU9_9BURK|nr:hypothetical protein [Massilia oculi]MCA1856513.1 hypothetical protein [Massilia oculi]